jgi:hypothetical protein
VRLEAGAFTQALGWGVFVLADRLYRNSHVTRALWRLAIMAGSLVATAAIAGAGPEGSLWQPCRVQGHPYGECDSGLYCRGRRPGQVSGGFCERLQPGHEGQPCRTGTSAPCDQNLFCLSSICRESCQAAADCDDAVFCNGRERCSPGAAGALPNGCAPAPESACQSPEVCDEQDDRCAVPGEDRDGDGAHSIATRGHDCNDNDPNAFHGNTEVCDPLGHDEDCNPETIGGIDRDGDGYISAAECP